MIIVQFFIAFFATMGFSILFSLNKESTFYASIVGATGWTVYYAINTIFSSPVAGSFLGALTVGVLGEALARVKRKPATLFITPGITPLVPGGGMYYTMLYLIDADYTKAATKGIETFLIAAAIAMGIIFSSTMSKSIRRVKQKD